MRRITFLSALAVLAVACLGSDFAASVEGQWQLMSGTVDGEAIPILESHPITIEFDDGQVGGTAACNGYGGTYELSDATLSLSDLAMTEMACSPDEVMEAEALYASALILVDHVEVNVDLTLTGPGAELMFEILEPVPDAELTNTVWELDSLIMGDAVSSVLGERATLEFFTDGSVLGGTGCRTFSAQYTVSGSEVVITDLASDGHQCEPPLADQDNQVLSVLQDGFQFDIEENRLSTIAGEEGLSYLAEG